MPTSAEYTRHSLRGIKTRHDLAVKLIREAGVEDSEKTSYERSLEERKYFQAENHKLWQKRHALRKAQCIFGKDSADAEALSDIWDTYQAQVDDLLRVYWDVCEDIARERESIRRYETDSQLADILAMAEVTAPQKPETKTNAPNVRFSLKKKTRKTSRKVHAPSWYSFH